MHILLNEKGLRQKFKFNVVRKKVFSHISMHVLL